MSFDLATFSLIAITCFAAFVNGALGYGFSSLTVPIGLLFYANRVLNTHPALLPAFKGWHAVRDALAAGVDETGCTVHIATLEVDSGPILAQQAVPILDGDDEDTLHARIKEVERHLYPATIKAVIEGKLP